MEITIGHFLLLSFIVFAVFPWLGYFYYHQISDSVHTTYVREIWRGFLITLLLCLAGAVVYFIYKTSNIVLITI
jgi:hypothetical protein